MPPNGFVSPEDAALDGFPRHLCHVVASRVNGDIAYVLLNTGSHARPYLYGAHCERIDGAWHEGHSSNASGWSKIGSDDDRGTMTLWDDAPPYADRARAKFNGESREAPVENGAFLFVWWNVGCPEDWPELEAFRIAGRWEPIAPGR